MWLCMKDALFGESYSRYAFVGRDGTRPSGLDSGANRTGCLVVGGGNASNEDFTGTGEAPAAATLLSSGLDKSRMT